MCRKLIVILAVLLVYGCIPAPTIYYKPESTAGQRVRIGSTEIAPADGWEMKAGNATVRLSITPSVWSSPAIFWFSVSVPPGSRAVFATTDIRIISDEREEVVTMKTLRYTEDKTRVSRTVSAEDVLVGGSVSFAFDVEAPRDYENEFELTGPLGDSCQVVLPDLSVDGQVHSFAPVRFFKKFGAGFVFING